MKWIQLACLAGMFLILSGCGRLDVAMGPVLHDVSMTPDFITPNADGDQDVTQIRYSLRGPARVSIYFEDADGQIYYFREDEPRAAGEYDVYWGGATADSMTIPVGDTVQEVISRVLPDGVYRWTVEAVTEEGESTAISGEITLQDGDSDIPQLNGFAVVPKVFTPNQDSIDDRVSISYSLSKDVDIMQVYLEQPGQEGVRFYIPPQPGVAEPNERGYHSHDYDGGVDLNAEPPPDGEYRVVAEARDAAGNAVRVTETLTLQEGGKPRADVKQGEIDWEGEVNRVISVPLGGQICFTAYVTNEGAVPIRTTGPWPGQEYQFTENYNTLASRGNESWYQQAGVWRFGINFDTTGVDFPFRWAVGRPEDLEMRLIDGKEQWYLMPGDTGEVSGCITMNEEPPVGTTFWHGGLIHEFVEIANTDIDRISVVVGVP